MTLAQCIQGLWLAELGLEPLLVVVLLAKGVWRKFPLFTAYSIWSMVGDLAEYSALRHSSAYVYFYVVNETVSVALVIALTYEIFAHLFASHQALRRLATVSLRVVCVLLVVLGATVFLAHSPIGQKGLVAGVLVVEESYRVLEVGLIISLFVFSGVFGLHWRRQMFGIVLGLGIPASVKLAVVAINPSSYVAVGIFNTAIMFSYDVGLLIWFGYLLIPERIVSVAELPQSGQLEQWNRAVMELIHQ